MANILEAKIIADTSGLESGLKKAEKLQNDYAESISKTQKRIADNITVSKQYETAIEQLNQEFKDGLISQKQFQQEIKKVGKEQAQNKLQTRDLRKELTALKRDQRDLAATTTTATKGMATLGKSTSNATPTVIEFSRVIQDAPYGIQGVANNIQQLTTNFGYLQKSAGGTIPALKALAGSFLGPAGIVFAVSVITSLLVSYGDKLSSSKSKAEELAEANEKAAEKMEKFIDTLSDVDRANLEANKSASEQIITLGQLRRQIEDTTNSTDLRLDGIKRLRAEFGGYFKNISDEALLNGTASTSYDVLTNSILKRAKATAATNILVRNAEKELEINERLKVVNDEIEKTEKAAQEFQKSSTEALRRDDILVGSINKKRKENNNLLDEQKTLQEQLSKISASNLELEAVVTANEVIIPEAPVKKDLEKIKELTVDQKEKLRAKLLAIEQDLNDQIFRDAEQTAKESAAIYAQYADKIAANADNTDLINSAKAFQDIQDIAKKIQEIQKQFPTLQLAEIDFAGMDLSQITAFETVLQNAQEKAVVFANVTGAALSGFSTKLADVFSTGNDIVDASMAALIKSGEQLLQDLIKQAIQAQVVKTAVATKDIAVNQAVSTSGAVAAASQTAAASGPAAAFLLPALIGAAVGFIAASFAGIKFAGGGIVPGGSYNGDQVPAFLNSGEVVLNGKQQAQILMRIAEGNVGGNKGNNKEDLVATTILRGQDQIVQIGRAKKHSKRFNG